MSSKVPYIQPAYRLSPFNCPFCHALAPMHWGDVYVRTDPGRVPDWTHMAICENCKRNTIWYEEVLVFPAVITVDDPNPDAPEAVKADYMEAATILAASPRGAAALLRLAIQKLCDHLVDGRGNLNAKIGTLVEQGLNRKIQQALDIVRVIGNEAVHPGQLDLRDDIATATQLFELVNIITDQTISEPARVDAMFNALPETQRQQIEQRDNS
jgi:hypothetical protein